MKTVRRDMYVLVKEGEAINVIGRVTETMAGNHGELARVNFGSPIASYSYYPSALADFARLDRTHGLLHHGDQITIMDHETKKITRATFEALHASGGRLFLKLRSWPCLVPAEGWKIQDKSAQREIDGTDLEKYHKITKDLCRRVGVGFNPDPSPDLLHKAIMMLIKQIEDNESRTAAAKEFVDRWLKNGGRRG